MRTVAGSGFFESAPGKGSNFHVWLPRGEAAEAGGSEGGQEKKAA